MLHKLLMIAIHTGDIAVTGRHLSTDHASKLGRESPAFAGRCTGRLAIRLANGLPPLIIDQRIGNGAHSIKAGRCIGK